MTDLELAVDAVRLFAAAMNDLERAIPESAREAFDRVDKQARHMLRGIDEVIGAR